MGRRMETRNLHSPEVEELLGGKLPFVARHGVTLALAVLMVLGTLFFFYGGVPRRMMLGIASHIMDQMKFKF